MFRSPQLVQGISPLSYTTPTPSFLRTKFVRGERVRMGKKIVQLPMLHKLAKTAKPCRPYRHLVQNTDSRLILTAEEHQRLE